MAPAALSPSASPPADALHSLETPLSYQGYAFVHWYVGNAKQAASYYVTRMGFERVAYRGLETGSKAIASHVVRNGSVTFVFTSPLHCIDRNSDRFTTEERKLLEEIHSHQEQHGDAVKGTICHSEDS